MDTVRRGGTQYYANMKDSEASSQEVVVGWLNEASMCLEASTRAELLQKIREYVINHDSQLLNIYLQDILAFQNDRNIEIRKVVISFIEDAIKKDIELLPKIIMNIHILLQDNCPQIQKRVIQTVTQVYKQFLIYMSKVASLNEEMQAVWNVLSNMKGYIINMVDSDKSGLRTQIVNFLETIVLLQTYLDPDSVKRKEDFSLDSVPLTLKIARRRKLEEEALSVFDLMLKFHGSSNISSANLMACMNSLTSIAKLRPQFMGKVIDALESLNLSLPPTLSKSQVSGVRKHLKMQLLGILKQPSAFEYSTRIMTLLTDLGATTSEVMKAYPKDDGRKRLKRTSLDPEQSQAKRARTNDESAVDITENFILSRLTPELVANMVVTFMGQLPDVMPPVFSATYTPIAAAGTQAQIKHVSRLLATLINSAGLGPGASIVSQRTQPSVEDDDEDMEESGPQGAVRGEGSETPREEATAAVEVSLGSSSLGPHLGPSKAIKLTDVAKPLSQDLRTQMEVMSVKRLLEAELTALKGGVGPIRVKLIATLAASFSFKIRETILEFIKGDMRNQIGLALSWLYEEYSLLQGFNKRPPNQLQDGVTCEKNYSQLLSTLISTVINNREIKEREMILSRLYTEIPLLTEEACELLKRLCAEEAFGLNIVNQLTTLRPPKQLTFLNLLLVNTSHQNHEIRDKAVKLIVNLYEREELKSIIEEFGVMYIGFLRLPQPPDLLFGLGTGRIQTSMQPMWTDDCIKCCLYLYLALVPVNQSLIHELGRVYVQTVAEVKRVILRLLDNPIKAMGMSSPHLLQLVEECPKGSETFVTRIIHILTDKCPPSQELVDRVRELYNTRVSDIRFLIPVLTGLEKSEVIAALPKLIKLNPVVVKEVFNRLLGSQADAVIPSPISPSELLIALHTIDSTLCELKTVIKATSLCFNNKEAYTQEVLAVVMQNLMEMSPLPTLLMRTVLQALSLYPRLIGFVMNILQRLILKQVWKQKKVWEGFVKCCERTQPHSFQVLLQLPAPQLADVFTLCPDLKQPLLDHIMSFTDNQRAHIPQNVMDILTGSTHSFQMSFKIKEEPMSPPDLTIDCKEDYDEMAKAYYEPAPPGMD